MRRSNGEYGATVTRRERENQIMDMRLERAKLNWTRSANSHTGPRHVIAASEAGHMSAPDHALCCSKRFFLHQRGRPHMFMMTVSPGCNDGASNCST